MAICTPFNCAPSNCSPFNVPFNQFGFHQGFPVASDCFGNCGPCSLPFCSPFTNCGPFQGFQNVSSPWTNWTNWTTSNPFAGFPISNSFPSAFFNPWNGSTPWTNSWNSNWTNAWNGNVYSGWNNPVSGWNNPVGGFNGFSPLSNACNFTPGTFNTGLIGNNFCPPGAFTNPGLFNAYAGTTGSFIPTPSFYNPTFFNPWTSVTPGAQNFPFPANCIPTPGNNGNIGLKRDVA